MLQKVEKENPSSDVVREHIYKLSGSRIGKGQDCFTLETGFLYNNHRQFCIKYMEIPSDPSETEKEKLSELQTELSLHQYLSELSLDSCINHPHIVKFIDGKHNGYLLSSEGNLFKACYIVMPYMPEGDLLSLFMKTRKGGLSRGLVNFYLHQILCVLGYLHENRVVHRDIKPENFLFDRDFNLKICDFGLASRVPFSNYKFSLKVGTYAYMSPQVLKGGMYTGESADLFAVGVLLFILRTGQPPFRTASHTDYLYQFIYEKKYSMFWKLHERQKKIHFSSEFKDLFQKLVSYEEKDRISIGEIEEHPFYLGELPSSEQAYEEVLKKKYRFV